MTINDINKRVYFWALSYITIIHMDGHVLDKDLPKLINSCILLYLQNIVSDIYDQFSLLLHHGNEQKTNCDLLAQPLKVGGFQKVKPLRIMFNIHLLVCIVCAPVKYLLFYVHTLFACLLSSLVVCTQGYIMCIKPFVWKTGSLPCHAMPCLGVLGVMEHAPQDWCTGGWGGGTSDIWSCIYV